MYKIGIVGFGFSGTMAAVQLIQKCQGPFEIVIVSEGKSLNKGVAFNPYSKQHLLNVATEKMSAFPDRSEHFLEWVMKLPEYKNIDKDIIAKSFLPRYLYGEYLCNIWSKASLLAQDKKIRVQLIEAKVTDIQQENDLIHLETSAGKVVFCHDLILSCGNQLPRNPPIGNSSFYSSTSHYFKNPWELKSVTGVPTYLPVLIIGNGLTMVDTLLGLLENGFPEKIISVSPHGYNLLPHRHNGIVHKAVQDEIRPGMALLELLSIINKHRKMIRKLGVSAEPIIDALRSNTHTIWQRLSDKEKLVFMKRLRHLWGVARHRVPLHIHDRIMDLRLNGKFQVYAGRIGNMVDGGNFVRVEIFDNKQKVVRKFDVSRVINCTGPESDIMQMEDSFLKKGMQKGYWRQDFLKLGIKATWPGMQVIGTDGKPNLNIYTLGSSLRGELWESTAVRELREQASMLADLLKEKAVKSKSLQSHFSDINES
jgi:uncharacterized NAD(P)/FAD-binding protein YdhS